MKLGVTANRPSPLPLLAIGLLAIATEALSPIPLYLLSLSYPLPLLRLPSLPLLHLRLPLLYTLPSLQLLLITLALVALFYPALSSATVETHSLSFEAHSLLDPPNLPSDPVSLVDPKEQCPREGGELCCIMPVGYPPNRHNT